MEQLDHRQLLSVNFTGNVATDFPASTSPGVVVLQNAPGTRIPQFPAGPTGQQLEDFVKVSGFTITGLRVSYHPSDDTLSIGIEQPDNQKTGQPLIAGDADNNLNSATVDPTVLALDPTFIDEPDLGGSETMGAFLDLNGDGIPDIVAGVPPAMSLTGPNTYQVAEAVVNPMNPSGQIPNFGTPLPQNTGTSYLVNDPASGAFEFAIEDFSQLYQNVTGSPLTPDRLIAIGAFGTSDTDDGISEAFYPANQPFRIGDATLPPPVECPPANPGILVNFHENNHIDTVHDTLIRVTVLGSSGFDVRDIIPETVRLGGAAPAFSFIQRVNADEFPDRTFVFRGPEVDLPPGWTQATVTGNLRNAPPGGPDSFESSVTVFNLAPDFYRDPVVAAAQRRQTFRSANGLRPEPAPGLSGYPLGLEDLPPSALAALHRNRPRFVPMTPVTPVESTAVGKSSIAPKMVQQIQKIRSARAGAAIAPKTAKAGQVPHSAALGKSKRSMPSPPRFQPLRTAAPTGPFTGASTLGTGSRDAL
jgi:hypothetical protein